MKKMFIVLLLLFLFSCTATIPTDTSIETNTSENLNWNLYIDQFKFYVSVSSNELESELDQLEVTVIYEAMEDSYREYYHMYEHIIGIRMVNAEDEQIKLYDENNGVDASFFIRSLEIKQGDRFTRTLKFSRTNFHLDKEPIASGLYRIQITLLLTSHETWFDTNIIVEAK